LGRHSGAAHSVAAVDGRTLVSGGADKLIRRWDLEDSTRRALWRGHSGNVASLAVVEQAGLLATGGRDGVRLWSLRNGVARAVPPGMDGPVAAIVRVSQLQLAVLGRDGHVKLWSLPDGSVRAVDVERVTCLAGVPDRGTTLMGTSYGRLLVLTTPEAVEPVALGTSHDGPVTAVCSSDSGDVIASAGADGQVLLWEPEVYRWDRLPLGEASRGDLERLEGVLAGPTTTQERPWLHLAAGLLRLRRRFDIEVGEPAVIEVGAFDIEIEG
jgi:WD40 repeat protein